MFVFFYVPFKCVWAFVCLCQPTMAMGNALGVLQCVVGRCARSGVEASWLVNSYRTNDVVQRIPLPLYGSSFVRTSIRSSSGHSNTSEMGNATTLERDTPARLLWCLFCFAMCACVRRLCIEAYGESVSMHMIRSLCYYARICFCCATHTVIHLNMRKAFLE